MKRTHTPGVNLYIFTGTPGTGKTTLIQHMRMAGLFCIQEPARPILTNQLKFNGPDLPSNSPLRFVQAMMRQMEGDFKTASKMTEPVFFDRGMPDLIAYAIRFGVEHEEFEKKSQAYRYHQTVFIFPPWKEIFVNDELRKLSFEESLAFHLELVAAYDRQGYKLIDVPKSSVEDRYTFVMNYLKESNQLRQPK